MPIAKKQTYLADLVELLKIYWPENRAVNIVCHGHSVPSAYFQTPMVDTFNAYPHLLHVELKERFPFAVINVIVTAIGGENSQQGAARFVDEVLCHRPDVLTIDYGLNDRNIGLKKARESWTSMIEQALAKKARLILLTPTPDLTQRSSTPTKEQKKLQDHAQQIRELADKYNVGLVDSLKLFERYVKNGGKLDDLLSSYNHPNKHGHKLVAEALRQWFPLI